MDAIQNYMHENVVDISSSASAKEAANKMLENSIGSLLVREDDKYIGILTHRDMSEKVVASNLNSEETTVASIMESPLITLDAFLPMNEALLSMKKNKIRHIVATMDGEVVGILSIQDFAHYHSLSIADPVSEFWSESEVLLDEKMFKQAFDKLLFCMSDKLGDRSKTGKAIKEKQPLSIIIKVAKEEGLNDFAEIMKLSND